MSATRQTQKDYTLPAAGKPPNRPLLSKIALEEHFDHVAAITPIGSRVDVHGLVEAMGYDPEWFRIVSERLTEFDEHRLAEMDASGIDVAILSQTVPGAQGIVDPAEAVSVARDINDFLAETIRRHPDRFAGFAHVALQDPKAAGEELERCIERLGFKGVMINGYTNAGDVNTGAYLDQPMFLPFWEVAAALNVPVYLHARPPLEQRVYEGHPQLIGATWGFAPETATHALRLVHVGLFDRFPNLTVILGHLGETLPYFSWRIQHCFEYNPADKKPQKRLQDYLCENFYVTTSGNFSDQALVCAVLTVGADRIMFSVDYPYEMMQPAARWLESAPISETDRRKIAHANARALFNIGV